MRIHNKNVTDKPQLQAFIKHREITYNAVNSKSQEGIIPQVITTSWPWVSQSPFHPTLHVSPEVLTRRGLWQLPYPGLIYSFDVDLPEYFMTGSILHENDEMKKMVKMLSSHCVQQ